MYSQPYESITFEVEPGLKKPENGYYKNGIKYILSSTFERAKKEEEDKNLSGREKRRRRMLRFSGEGKNESLEILHYNFDTEKTEFYNSNKKSLIQGLIEAYKNHYPITVTPDMIWLLFLQGYSRFMEKYHEWVRTNYVNFENKKTIHVARFDMIPEKATKEEWQDILNEFTQKIKNNVGENIISSLESNFSTTSKVSLTTSQLSIMSAMKNYFTYKCLMVGCGVSSITLEGSLEDWQKIKSKLEFFSKKEMCLLWWIKHLIPIIDKIIMTKNYYNQNKTINEEIRNFWKDMIRFKKGVEYNPNYINGWIIKFIPNYEEQKPKLYDELKEDDVPDQIISCPFELTALNMDKTKTIYKCSLASGFFGMIQDEKTFNVKPIIGYAVVVEEKETSRATEEEAKNIIEEFFC